MRSAGRMMPHVSGIHWSSQKNYNRIIKYWWLIRRQEKISISLPRVLVYTGKKNSTLYLQGSLPWTKMPFSSSYFYVMLNSDTHCSKPDFIFLIFSRYKAIMKCISSVSVCSLSQLFSSPGCRHKKQSLFNRSMNLTDFVFFGPQSKLR